MRWVLSEFKGSQDRFNGWMERYAKAHGLEAAEAFRVEVREAQSLE